jgi:hypothetical protein
MDYQVIPFFGVDKVVGVIVGLFKKVNDQVFMKLFRFRVIGPVEQLDKVSLETLNFSPIRFYF